MIVGRLFVSPCFRVETSFVQFVTNIPEFLSGGGNLCLYLNSITKMILHVIFKFGYGRLFLCFRFLQIADHSLHSLDFGLCFCDATIKT